MKNWLYKFWVEMSNHNRYKSIFFLISCAVLVWLNGCQIKVASITNPSRRISISELQSEIDTINNRIDDRIADINDQLAIRDFAWNTAVKIAQTGVFDWYGFLTSAGCLIGAGALTDNIRYRIKRNKS